MASPSIRKLIDLLQVYSRVERKPGFSHVLGLSYPQIRKENLLKVDAASLTLRIPITSQLLQTQTYEKAAPSVLLSTYMAMMDEVTTWSLVLADAERGRAGVSVSLQGWTGPAFHRLTDSVDMTTQVLKVGRNLGFCRAEVRSAHTGDLVCSGSHIKYLPSGNVLVDFLQSSYGWNLLKRYTEYSNPSPTTLESTNLGVGDFFRSFQQDDHRATFVAQPIHLNPLGSLHGGCVAMLMEMAAAPVAKQELLRGDDDTNVTIVSQSVEYMSPPNTKEIELQVERISLSQDGRTVDLRVTLSCKGQARSVGRLQFTRKLRDPFQERSKL
jgi:acyl-coenzyme A thioesterase PaaI-like protein